MTNNRNARRPFSVDICFPDHFLTTEIHLYKGIYMETQVLYIKIAFHYFLRARDISEIDIENITLREEREKSKNQQFQDLVIT